MHTRPAHTDLGTMVAINHVDDQLPVRLVIVSYRSAGLSSHAVGVVAVNGTGEFWISC